MEKHMDRFNKCLSDAITAYRLSAYSDENMPLNDENVYQSGFEAGWNAFNEGRQGLIDNIPELEWKSLKATSIIGTFRITNCLNSYIFYLDDMKHWKYFDNIEDTKQAANEYYKNRIKKALGL